MKRGFIKAGNILVPLCDVEDIDIADIERGSLRVTYGGGKTAKAQDFDAFEIVMLLHPAALEGRRLRWEKNAWAFHNLVAHPLMQILVWLGFRRLAIRLHDATVPRPTDLR